MEPHIRVISPLKIRGITDDDGRSVKALDAEGRLNLTTLASTPDIDEVNEIVEPEAFASSIDRYAEIPVMLAYHDMKQPVGLWPEQSISAQGLALSGFISGGRPDVQKLVLDGVIAHTSIGFFVKDRAWDDELEVMRIKDLDLVEVSLVPIPANRSTFITLGESLAEWRDRETRAFKNQRSPEVPDPAPEEGPTLPSLDELIARAFRGTPTTTDFVGGE
jgi:HK97 family phage prohead protease